MLPNTVSWYDTSGTLIQSDTALMQADTIFNAPIGAYYFITTDGGACPSDSLLFSIPDSIQLVIDSVKHTTCIGCLDGIIYFRVLNGNGPFTYSPNPNGLPAGSYTFCVTDANGCMVCDTTTILDDPLSTGKMIDSKEISIFPNPVINTVTFRMKNANIDGIRIFDSKGLEIKLQVISSSNKSLSLNTSQLDQGMYTVEITSSSARYFKRMMVTR